MNANYSDLKLKKRLEVVAATVAFNLACDLLSELLTGTQDSNYFMATEIAKAACAKVKRFSVNDIAEIIDFMDEKGTDCIINREEINKDLSMDTLILGLKKNERN